MHGFAAYVKKGFHFVQDLSLENSTDSYLFSTGFTTLSVLLLFALLITLCTVFYSISSNIDEVLSINPSANVFFFGNFNTHHKDWLTNSGKTDRPGELCYNFSISNDLTQTLNFPFQFWSCCCLSFLWLSTRCPVLSYSLWLFFCWLGRSSWSFKRCSWEDIF